MARTGTEDRVGVGWGCSLGLAFILWSALYFLQGFRRVSAVVGEVLILKLGSFMLQRFSAHRLPRPADKTAESEMEHSCSSFQRCLPCEIVSK